MFLFFGPFHGIHQMINDYNDSLILAVMNQSWSTSDDRKNRMRKADVAFQTLLLKITKRCSTYCCFCFILIRNHACFDGFLEEKKMKTVMWIQWCTACGLPSSWYLCYGSHPVTLKVKGMLKTKNFTGIVQQFLFQRLCRKTGRRIMAAGSISDKVRGNHDKISKL